MKNIIDKTKLLIIFFGLFTGCEDFLDTQPYGTTTLKTLSKQTSGADALLIGAYSCLDGFASGWYTVWFVAGSNWINGSITGGDAYKGSDIGDQIEITYVEVHNKLTASNPFVEAKWAENYHAISRANDALNAFKSLDGIDEKFRQKRMAEARFLRGFFHFELRKMFGFVPYIDETVEDVRIGNEADIFPMILDDFLYASKYLPKTQDEPGRATKGAAQSYVGIVNMWMHEYETAKIYFDSVITSNRYKLNEHYHENFNAEFRNTNESILEVQGSVNDGAGGANGNFGDLLNQPFNVYGSCCGFHQPSQNLVNAFKTDASGLPLLYTYNDSDVKNDDGLTVNDPFVPETGTLDPRLDWTVGRRDIPYLDWGKHSAEFIRDQHNGGPYSPKKNVIYQSQLGQYSDNSWNSVNANNLKLLRYADLLLYAAEAQVELGNLGAAMDLVNEVRSRAANPEGFVMDGAVPAANYLINVYPDGHFDANGKEYARDAVRFERRLELGMEGHRFFDLVRWGIAAEEKNKYFEKEREKRTHLSDAHFTEGKNEFLPIPQNAIDRSHKDGIPTLQQNPNYN